MTQCLIIPQLKKPDVLILPPRLVKQEALLMRILLTLISRRKLIPSMLLTPANMQENVVANLLVRTKRKIRDWIYILCIVLTEIKSRSGSMWERLDDLKIFYPFNLIKNTNKNKSFCLLL